MVKKDAAGGCVGGVGVRLDKVFFCLFSFVSFLFCFLILFVCRVGYCVVSKFFSKEKNKTGRLASQRIS